MRAIDADAMLEYLNLMYDKQNDSNEPFNCAVLGAINYIKHKAPTIDAVSVVHGEWIPCTKSGLLLTELMRREGQKWYGYRCSNCNHIYKGNALKSCNYCPNCGCAMTKEQL